MAMAALRGALRALPGSSRCGALRGEAGQGGYLQLQQRAAYTESEAKALARVRRLAKELNQSVEAFPDQSTEAPNLSIEFMKLRQHQKYYKNGMWVLISLSASMTLTASYAILQLDRDVGELKEKLAVAQKEILYLKRTARMSTLSTPFTPASGADADASTPASGATASTPSKSAQDAA